MEENDPRRCLDEGKAVTACALNVFKNLKKHCLEDFNAYMYCLERSSGTLEFSPYVTLYLADNKKKEINFITLAVQYDDTT
jgi:hypothetical protein